MFLLCCIFNKKRQFWNCFECTLLELYVCHMWDIEILNLHADYNKISTTSNLYKDIEISTIDVSLTYPKNYIGIYLLH